MKKKVVIYVHGKGGSAAESKHYESLFSDSDVVGLEYQNDVPWKVGEEIFSEVSALKKEYKDIVLVANSIGAYFSMHAGIDELIKKAYFVSPIVDMEGMIQGLMRSISLSEEELKIKGRAATPFGEDVTWEYLCFVREHPIDWTVPTHILYGDKDKLTPYQTIKSFADRFGSTLTVMEGGEHWFHTEEQMKFLDQWIGEKERCQ